MLALRDLFQDNHINNRYINLAHNLVFVIANSFCRIVCDFFNQFVENRIHIISSVITIMLLIQKFLWPFYTAMMMYACKPSFLIITWIYKSCKLLPSPEGTYFEFLYSFFYGKYPAYSSVITLFRLRGFRNSCS